MIKMKMLTRKEFFELPKEELKMYLNKAQEQKENRIGELYEAFGDKTGSTNIFYSDDDVWKKELEKILNSEYLPLIFSDLESAISLSLYKDPIVMSQYLLKKELHNITKELRQNGRTMKKIGELLTKLTNE